MLDKRQLRQWIREQKKLSDPLQRERQSEAISQTVLHHPHVRTAKVILLYKALPDEVETQMLLDQLEEEGKTVLLPVVIGPDKLELRLYEGIGKMREGTYNIQEPVGKAFLNLAQIDTAVVPGMAFDYTGNRLGRGRGYYDRLLRQMPNCYKIGICFDFQKLPQIPIDPNDVRMDEVITYSLS
ncbi:MAG: 5-formyltetrahydrofolate cyclo-ligase [Prevotella sp.]|jgi:5-formyltetrahydrofolate cyclo-ligase|nr:5-formyltetrahydrofolate cyclo-ligase [Prevotella sp.]